MSDSSDEEPEEWLDPTYGDRAPMHLSTKQITAAQHRALTALVSEYVVKDGEERTNFVQQVRLLSP